MGITGEKGRYIASLHGRVASGYVSWTRMSVSFDDGSYQVLMLSGTRIGVLVVASKREGEFAVSV
jgi:hypothetical protein